MANIDKSRFDALVVLGCRVRFARDREAGDASPKLVGALARRVARAADLYREQLLRGASPWVVASGGRAWPGDARAREATHVEADAMRDALVRLGVPGDRILCERRSLSTRENARRTRSILASIGAARVAVVTCDFHLPRALAYFAIEAIEADGIAAISPARGRFDDLVRDTREAVAIALARAEARVRSILPRRR